MKTKILVVDDHDVVRQGVQGLLASHSDWEVCGEASDGQQALSAISKLHPDIVILDVSMPIMNGIEVTRRIRENGRNPRIVILTMHESAGMITEAQRAGADACVCKSHAGRDLVAAIDAVLSGKDFFFATAKRADSKVGTASTSVG